MSQPLSKVIKIQKIPIKVLGPATKSEHITAAPRGINANPNLQQTRSF